MLFVVAIGGGIINCDDESQGAVVGQQPKLEVVCVAYVGVKVSNWFVVVELDGDIGRPIDRDDDDEA